MSIIGVKSDRCSYNFDELNQVACKNEIMDGKLKKEELDSVEAKVMWDKFSAKGQEIIKLCHYVPLEVVNLGRFHFIVFKCIHEHILTDDIFYLYI